IVDCGGQDNLAMRAAMSVATYVVIPLRPKRRDLKTLPHMEDMLSTCKMVNPKMIAAIVITQCPALPSQGKRILEAKEVVESFGLRALNSVTFSRNIYDDSEESGSSVLEIDPNGKAADEIRAIADELFAIPPENSYEFN
ncbi:MAG TPA: chromosome partitioning protein ParA, partial [Shewanella frigidimarina]|nr:chromosome partitioning protein ParA [Shewanella frigidimarina]